MALQDLTLSSTTDHDSAGNRIKQDVVFPFDPFDAQSDGQTVSRALAKKFVATNKWVQELPLTEIVAVTFDARPLLLILAQKNCTGIRFYDAINQAGKKTLVLVGIDSNDHDLGTTPPSLGKIGSIMTDLSPIENELGLNVEVGGGDKFEDF